MYENKCGVKPDRRRCFLGRMYIRQLKHKLKISVVRGKESNKRNHEKRETDTGPVEDNGVLYVHTTKEHTQNTRRISYHHIQPGRDRRPHSFPVRLKGTQPWAWAAREDPSRKGGYVRAATTTK